MRTGKIIFAIIVWMVVYVCGSELDKKLYMDRCEFLQID